MDRESNLKMTEAGRRGTPALGFSPESQGYLILLFIVQLLSIGIWLSDERVHQHQEGHVEQQGPYHRQVDDDNDLRKTSALFSDPAPEFPDLDPPWLPVTSK